MTSYTRSSHLKGVVGLDFADLGSACPVRYRSVLFAVSTEAIIGAAVAITLAVLFGVKSWLHNLLNFKMDESAIVNFLQDVGDEHESCSSAAIAAGTTIDEKRVAQVCSKSKAIEKAAQGHAVWRLK